MGAEPQGKEGGGNPGGESEGVGILTCILLFIIIAILFLWYRSISLHNHKIKDEKIFELTEQIQQTRKEIDDLKDQIEVNRILKEKTICEEVLKALDEQVQELTKEIRIATEGEPEEEHTGSDIRVKLQDATKKNKVLVVEYEKMRNSVVMPETEHIADDYGRKEVTPVNIVEKLLLELENSRGGNMRINKENKDLKMLINCLSDQIKLKDKTILELEDQVACAEKIREINRLLEDQIADNKAEKKALKKISDEKTKVMGDLQIELRRKDDTMKKINKNIAEQEIGKQQLMDSLKKDIDRKNKAVRELMKHFEREEEVMKCLVAELTLNFCGDTRSFLQNKLTEIQTCGKNIKKHFGGFLEDKFKGGDGEGKMTNPEIALNVEKIKKRCSNPESRGNYCC